MTKSKTNHWLAFDDGFKFRVIRVASDTPNSYQFKEDAVAWYIRSLELAMIAPNQRIKNLEAQRKRALAWKK